MSDTTSDNARRRRTRLGWAAGLLAAGGLAGGLLASALPAGADPSPGPSASSSTAAQPPTDRGAAGGAGGQRPDETVLTGSDAEKAKAAALAAVPGATVDRVETDADGDAYEAHLTKSDGTKVTVKFDTNFAVTAVQDGMGKHK